MFNSQSLRLALRRIRDIPLKYQVVVQFYCSVIANTSSKRLKKIFIKLSKMRRTCYTKRLRYCDVFFKKELFFRNLVMKARCKWSSHQTDPSCVYPVRTVQKNIRYTTTIFIQPGFGLVDTEYTIFLFGCPVNFISQKRYFTFNIPAIQNRPDNSTVQNL